MKINKIPSKEQREAIKFLQERRKAIVCYGTGSGKTLVMLIHAILEMQQDKVDGTIILGTNSALKSIRKELLETFGMKPITLEHLLHKEKGIVLIAYQDLKEIVHLIPKGNYMLILDEYHKVKSSKSETTKLSNKLKMKCRKWYGFTATPIMKDFKDLYSLVKWMNPLLLGTWETFCKNYTMYYKIPSGKAYDIIKPYKFRNFEKLKRVLKEIVISYFPDYDITYVDKYCPLEDIEGYRKVIKESLTPTGDDERDKALPMLAVKNCRNFVSISKGKLLLLLKTLKEIIQYGVIIYCDEYATLNPVYKLLVMKGFNVLKYTGKQSTKLNDKSMDDFVNNPSNKILLISRVAGASLNLQATNRLIMFDMPSSIGGFQQLMGRVARKYSDYDSYYIYLLLTKGSVEEYWYLYLTMYSEPLRKLFNNGLVPTGIPSYNEFMKKQLINDKVWNK